MGLESLVLVSTLLKLSFVLPTILRASVVKQRSTRTSGLCGLTY